jgi:hypothetical protein
MREFSDFRDTVSEKVDLEKSRLSPSCQCYLSVFSIALSHPKDG